jgi:HD-GYP domain-containing protein (c-di-GMP phosphodiesterase class II)
MTKELILFIKDLLESFDPYGLEHGERVSVLCVKLARLAGVSAEELHDIETAGMIHDLGKIKIPASILRITGKYLPSEFESMSHHSVYGYDMLMKVVNGTINTNVALCVKYHHKDFSGGGYPKDEVKGDQIPFGARVIRIADSYDAMTHDRGYRRALDQQGALQDLVDYQIQHTAYDPDLLRLFLEMMKDN